MIKIFDIKELSDHKFVLVVKDTENINKILGGVLLYLQKTIDDKILWLKSFTFKKEIKDENCLIDLWGKIYNFLYDYFKVNSIEFVFNVNNVDTESEIAFHKETFIHQISKIQRYGHIGIDVSNLLGEDIGAYISIQEIFNKYACSELVFIARKHFKFVTTKQTLKFHSGYYKYYNFKDTGMYINDYLYCLIGRTYDERLVIYNPKFFKKSNNTPMVQILRDIIASFEEGIKKIDVWINTGDPNQTKEDYSIESYQIGRLLSEMTYFRFDKQLIHSQISKYKNEKK